MSGKPCRADIINYLVAVCVKNNVTPEKAAFAGLIREACADKFVMDKYKAKSYVSTLISSWRLSRWRTWVRDSPYLTFEEKERWLEQHE